MNTQPWIFINLLVQSVIYIVFIVNLGHLNKLMYDVEGEFSEETYDFDMPEIYHIQ